MRFCTYCGALSQDTPLHATRSPSDRVCKVCELGVLLVARRDAVREAGGAFLVSTADGTITAVSRAAQELFFAPNDVEGQRLEDVVAVPEEPQRLRDAVERAARGGADVTDLVVDVVMGARGPIRASARVAACGPPPAALVVLEAERARPDAGVSPIRPRAT